jgi:3-methyladenine DNA glycosylase/8-oxoguanine DNA glycosylase
LRALARTNGARPTARELLARAERWRPWRAYAAQYLWSANGALPLESAPGDDGPHDPLD